MTTGRRGFIMSAGVAIAGALLNRCKNITNPQPQKKLGVALVGLGNYSTNLLAPAMEHTQFCELRGIVTGTPSKIERWQRQYGIPDGNVYNYDTMYRMADNDDIDVVYIVVPTALHSKYAVIAAEAGKHVWCEKPMAYTEQQCLDIISACQENQVRLAIGYRMLHEPNTIKANGFATSRPFGPITAIEANAGYRGGGGTGWRFVKEMGGGAMYDMGVYTVNGLRHALNEEPVRVVSARHVIDRPELFKEVDETTEYVLEFPSGITANGWTSVGNNKNFMRITCERGWYQLEPMQAYSGVTGTTSSGEVWPPIKGMQQTLQMDDDALAIMNGTPMIAPGEDGMRDIKIIEAIFESAATGQSVSL